MLPHYLIAISAGIVLAMGTGHLYLTLFSNAFEPRDAALYEQIRTVPLNFARAAITGPCLTGFNASHSLGVMLFGLLYGYLALEQGELLFHSPFLLALGACFFAAYIALALRYWFYGPLIGLLIATAFYAGGIVAA